MRVGLFVAGLLVAVSPVGRAQQAAPDFCVARQRASFDVVSVHVMANPGNRSRMQTREDSVTASGQTVKRLLVYGFNIRDFQISGLPDWGSTVQFEISGKLDTPEPDSAKMTAAERAAWRQRFEERLQFILMDRFQLKCHTEIREMPVYELVVAKSGPKFHETKAEQAKQNTTNMEGRNLREHLEAVGVPTWQLASLLSNEAGRVVLDKTGLTGKYDIAIDWMHDAPASSAPDSQPTDSPQGPTLFTAVEEQLGLKLVPAKGPVPVLVIDRVERPSEN